MERPPGLSGAAVRDHTPASRPLGEVARLWDDHLANGGYEHHCHSRLHAAWIQHHAPSVLRRVIRLANLRSGARVLEVGCGGGAMLAPLALMGCAVTGVDGSAAVLARARHYLDELSCNARRRMTVDLVEADFLELTGDDWRDAFEVTLSFGVIEHFLEAQERNRFLRKMAEATRRGGAVASVVPAGAHPLRQVMRERELGGYHIPEVDYTLTSLAADLASAGLVDVRVVGHNLLGYLCTNPNRHKRRFYRMLVLALKLLPMSALPETITGRYVDTFIAIGRRG